eukprot:7633530-Pyramimonas_sp.AAC.1
MSVSFSPFFCAQAPALPSASRTMPPSFWPRLEAENTSGVMLKSPMRIHGGLTAASRPPILAKRWRLAPVIPMDGRACSVTMMTE